MSIEFEPPVWAPYAIPSAQGWRHPVTKELLVAIPGGVKTKPGIVNETPVAVPVIEEKEKVAEVLNETIPDDKVINESPVEIPVIEEKVTEVKTQTKRGPKPKVK